MAWSWGVWPGPGGMAAPPVGVRGQGRGSAGCSPCCGHFWLIPGGSLWSAWCTFLRDRSAFQPPQRQCLCVCVCVCCCGQLSGFSAPTRPASLLPFMVVPPIPYLYAAREDRDLVVTFDPGEGGGSVEVSLCEGVRVPCSELAEPRQVSAGARHRGDCGAHAEEEVFLLRPERGQERPHPAQPAVCASEATPPLTPSHPHTFSPSPPHPQSRDAIVDGTHPCTREEGIQFGALQCQVHVVHVQYMLYATEATTPHLIIL